MLIHAISASVSAQLRLTSYERKAWRSVARWTPAQCCVCRATLPNHYMLSWAVGLGLGDTEWAKIEGRRNGFTTELSAAMVVDRGALSVASRGFLLHSDFFQSAPAPWGWLKKKIRM